MSEEKVLSNNIESKKLPPLGEHLIERSTSESGKVERPESLPERKAEAAPAEPVQTEKKPPSLPLAVMPPGSYSFATKEREKRIEKVLEDGLAGIYAALPPEKKVEFRAKGEETAKKINLLLNEAKVKVRGIIELIIEWLKIIPGVNRFFLEQEAKIKADEIIKLAENKNNKI